MGYVSLLEGDPVEDSAEVKDGLPTILVSSIPTRTWETTGAQGAGSPWKTLNILLMVQKSG